MSKKQALTRAAAELLWERGYTGTSPAMILERANAGQGSMYHHFSGKAELAVAAMSDMSDHCAPARRRLCPGTVRPSPVSTPSWIWNAIRWRAAAWADWHRTTR